MGVGNYRRSTNFSRQGTKMNVYIGWDSREEDAYKVADFSLKKHSSLEMLQTFPIKQKDVREAGLYHRTDDKPGEGASVEFTYTRFLVPYLNDYKGWALFVDCDFLFTKDIAELFNMRDEKYALMCVQHDYVPKASIKMDGQKQTTYPRKNWSSCVLWNCGHPANNIIVPPLVNTASGAYLHRFQWLDDDMIGSLPLEWNWLEGEYDKPEDPPAVVHYTNGGPWFEDHKDCDYGQEWLDTLAEVKKEESIV